MKEVQLVYRDLIVNLKIFKSLRTSISISISHKKGIVVKSPLYIPDLILKKYIENKKEWIFENWEKIVKSAINKDKKFISQEEHYFLGKKYKLEISVASNESIFIDQDKLKINVVRNSPVVVKNLLSSWYHDKGVKILFEEYKKACQIFASKNIKPRSLKYKKLKGKWGACTHDNHIYLNPDLIKTPLACIEYVIYHELCHIMHHNHSARFYKFLTEMMPDWKLRREKLRFIEKEI